MKGYIANIKALTSHNTHYRQVLYTAHYSQLVVMSIESGDKIGEEVHGLDQFIYIESGSAQVMLDGVIHEVQDDFGIVIPAGTPHNVINIGSTPLKLFTVYSPPEHKDGTIHITKASESEEHFNGKTTE